MGEIISLADRQRIQQLNQPASSIPSKTPADIEILSFIAGARSPRTLIIMAGAELLPIKGGIIGSLDVARAAIERALKLM